MKKILTMKKFPVYIIALLALGIILFAQEHSSVDYDGPLDDTYWSGTLEYNHANNATRLANLARYFDAIGVGTMSNMQTNTIYSRYGEYTRYQFMVDVDQALVGCTNVIDTG